MIKIVRQGDKNQQQQKIKQLLSRGVAFDPELMARVAGIIDDVRRRGDSAVIEYTSRFDGVQLEAQELNVSLEILETSAAQVDSAVVDALRLAIHNVREFHERQLEHSWELHPDAEILLGQRLQAIDSVGLYVPGGTAAYPSSVVMNVVPAQVAGVRRIAVTTPPKNLAANPAVAAALIELGVTEIYSVGGAQAIGALAYGTQTIPSVDKIAGPGNQFVAAAKQLVFGVVGVDSIAGPTELVIIADDTARAVFVAADLLAQAEHGEDSAAVLITTSPQLAEAVMIEIDLQIDSLLRADIIRRSCEENGLIIIADTIDEACDLVNQLAPEHVQVMTSDADRDAQKIIHAGAIFIGSHTPTAVGDYFAGPNHVLPTGGTARFSSPLGVNDFMKRTNVIRYSESALRAAAESIATLATVEGLQGHAQSATIRLNKAR